MAASTTVPTTRLIARLAWRNVRHRPWQAVLLLVTLCLTTTSLSLALIVRETSDGAWDRLSDRTQGFHVYAKTFLAPGASPDRTEGVQGGDALARLASAPGVVAVGGPWRGVYTRAEVGGAQIELRVQIREDPIAPVDQPLVTSGRWLDDDTDGVVLEDGLASTLHVEPGDNVTIAGVRLPVLGTAMTVSTTRYPDEVPGLGWVGASTGARIPQSEITGMFDWLQLRLSDPENADRFLTTHAGNAIGETTCSADGSTCTISSEDMEVHSWLERRDDDEADTRVEGLGLALLVAGTLLAGLTLATAAVLVAGRMAAQIRQVGTLKAIGVTPAQVCGVLLVEHLAVAALATLVGLGVGTWLSPLLARSVVTLYGGPQAPPVTPARVVIVGGIALLIVLVATVRPALRGVRASTIRALAPSVRAPRQPRRGPAGSGAGRLHLPVSAALGLRSALRRRGRTVADTVGLALAVAMVVIGLALHDGWQRWRSSPDWASDDPTTQAANQDLYHELLTVVLVSATLLLVLAAINTVIAAVFAARDNARGHAILRSLGATPGQTVATFVISQLGAGVLACVIGISLGVAIFDLVRNSISLIFLLHIYIIASNKLFLQCGHFKTKCIIQKV